MILPPRTRPLELLVFDVDGVLTDGGLWYDADGEALKRFNAKDGYGIVLAREQGLTVAFLSARRSAPVLVRAKELGVSKVYAGRADKGAALFELCAELDMTLEQTAYMGDDLMDLPALEIAGLSVAPRDAVPEVRAAVQVVTRRRGGHGAARELIDAVLADRRARR